MKDKIKQCVMTGQRLIIFQEKWPSVQHKFSQRLAFHVCSKANGKLECHLFLFALVLSYH